MATNLARSIIVQQERRGTCIATSRQSICSEDTWDATIMIGRQLFDQVIYVLHSMHRPQAKQIIQDMQLQLQAGTDHACVCVLPTRLVRRRGAQAGAALYKKSGCGCTRFCPKSLQCTAHQSLQTPKIYCTPFPFPFPTDARTQASDDEENRV